MTQQPILGSLGKPQPKPPQELHPLQLAYVGDALYELYVRNHLLQKGIRKTQELQKEAIAYVSAVAQAQSCHRIIPLLNEEEQEVIKKGRNAKSGRSPKSATVTEYRYSTGIEALFGYLYLEQREARIQELMKIILEEIDKERSS